MAARSIGLHPAEYPLSSLALQAGTGCLQDSHPGQHTTRHHSAGHCTGAGPAGEDPQEDGGARCCLWVGPGCEWHPWGLATESRVCKFWEGEKEVISGVGLLIRNSVAESEGENLPLRVWLRGKDEEEVHGTCW